VPPPEGFADDLKILGDKFEPEKGAEEAVSIQSSIEAITSSPASAAEPASPATSSVTPALPQFNPLANFTPEQIQQLAFLQYLQNFGGFNGFPNMGNPLNQQQVRFNKNARKITDLVFSIGKSTQTKVE
jgi:hypothetical protein